MAASSSSAAANAASASSSVSQQMPQPPVMHKTTASGHVLSVRIPDAVSAKQAAGGSGDQSEQPMLWGLQLRYVSLVTLALQNASLTIIMHYSRISVAPSEQYSAATAVLMNELLKGSISLAIALKRIDNDLTAAEHSAAVRRGSFSALSPASLYASEKERADVVSSPDAKAAAGRGTFFGSLAHGGPAAAASSLVGASRTAPNVLRRTALGACLAKAWRPRLARLRAELFSPDCWKLSIPAILYVVQNNLQYVAASNLDVATFQVTYQMKILTTAGFSVLMLGKRLTSAKWIALGCLALGVGIVQIQGQAAAGGGGGAAHAAGDMHPLKGFAAVTAACFTSGLAGVYFEKVLKGSQADLWVRNVQLSLFSLVPAVLPVLFAAPSPAAAASAGGASFLARPFHNFNIWAWATIAVQVFGGLVTALVIKYSDNILKGFATSLSIVISFLVSVGVFGYSITPAFVLGGTTVLGATWMYNQPDAPGVAGGVRGSGRMAADGRESRAPGSPIPADAPIIGEFRRKPASAPSSVTNLLTLLSAALTPAASPRATPVPSGASSPNRDGFARYGRDGPAGGYFTPADGGTQPGTPGLGASWEAGGGAKKGGWP